MFLNLNLTPENDPIKWVYRIVGPLASASVMAKIAKTWILSGQKGCDQDPRQITTAAAHKRAQLWQRWWPIIRPHLGVVKKIANSRRILYKVHKCIWWSRYKVYVADVTYYKEDRISFHGYESLVQQGSHYHNATRRFITSRERKKQQVLWVGPGFWPLYGFPRRFNGLWLWNTTP